MRRKIIRVLLCVFILASVCTAVLAAGRTDDPLISVSWLYETLMPRLRELLGREESGVERLANEYETRLDGISFDRSDASEDDTDKLALLTLREDDAVTLDEFACFLLMDGAAKLRCNGCEVIDLNAGAPCADGSWLTARHHYFVAEGSAAVIYIYSDAQGYLDGSCNRETDTVFPAADRYRDTEGHWAEDSIGQMTEMGAVNGVEKHRFAPDIEVSRAMFVTVLCRLFGAEDEPYKSVFSDVKDGDWYAPYVNWAAANNIVTGHNDGTFRPNDLLTREQMAAILVRCCEKFDFELPDEAGTAGFTDAETVSDWARDAVELVRRSGLMGGRENGEFDPTGTATRAEMCAVFCRLYEKAE